MIKNIKNNNFAIFQPSPSTLLGTLLISFFLMLIITGGIQILINKIVIDERNAFLLGSVAQSILVFIFPSWLTALLSQRYPYVYLGLDTNVRFRQFIGVMILFLFMTPAMNLIVEWNASLLLPDSLSSLEKTLRQWEETAAQTTNMVLGDTSIWGLISGILIVGFLTGFAEEMFFRAGFQRALCCININKHIAVWTAAFIFSAIHFQFFGFIPRLLIGALMGYLYLYTKSLWVAAFAHALNNSIVVLTSWLLARGYMTVQIDKLGTGYYNDVWIALLSLFVTVLFVKVYGRQIFRPHPIKFDKIKAVDFR